MTHEEQTDNNMFIPSDFTENLHDDPRMTAYLLNELDPSEKEEWERILRDNPAIQAEQDVMKETIDRVNQSLQNEPLVPGGVVVSTNDATGNTEAVDSVSSVEAKSQKVPSGIHNPLFRIVLTLTAASLLIALSVSYSGNGIKFGQFGCNGSHHGTDVARRTSPFTQRSVTTQEPATLQKDSEPVSQPDMETRQQPSLGVEQNAPQAEVHKEIIRRETVSVVPQKPAPEKKTSVVGNAKLKAPVPMVPSAPSVQMKSQGRTDAGIATEIPESSTLSDTDTAVYSRGVPHTRQNMVNGWQGGMSRPVYGVNSKPQGMVVPRVIKMEEQGSVPDSRNRIVQGNVMPRQIVDSGEDYSPIKENEFVPTKDETFSTFSIDVDTASYTNVRRFLNMGRLPPAPAVKIEELVNYFKYDYAPPKSDAKEPFAAQVEVEPCPWESSHILARVAIKGKVIPQAKRPPLNLVFLIDVSGSMGLPNKLPLVKRAFEELVNQLDERDRVAIVTYAGSAKVHLKTTKGNLSQKILRSIDKLEVGGSTAGADGICVAYDTAREQFNKDGVNRVILCTDGDFNVGITNNKELENMIAQRAKSGVFLTVLGFGMGNYKDERLATLSNRGNGNYGYIDDMSEARRLFVDGLTGTLVTIAKDVKIQIDFNPGRVAAWRLIGYEDRKLATEDFNNDRKDAGEIGAGHNVTALYEIVPVGAESPWLKRVDKSRYATDDKKDDKAAKTSESATKSEGKPKASVRSDLAAELMFVKLRYKKPDGNKSELVTFPVVYDKDKKVEPTADFKFASSVALFGMLLRNSQYAGTGSYEMVLSLADEKSQSSDAVRSEYLSLVKKAKRLAGQ